MNNLNEGQKEGKAKPSKSLWWLHDGEMAREERLEPWGQARCEKVIEGIELKEWRGEGLFRDRLVEM